MRYGNRTRLGAQAEAWLPRLAGVPSSLAPVAWFDASDTSTITASSGAVSQWNDKSGNGYNLSQATGLNQPTTGTRTQNGLNVIDFDGSNDWLRTGNVIAQIVTSKAMSIFWVVKSDTVAAARAMLSIGRTNWDIATCFAALQEANSVLSTGIGIGDGDPNNPKFVAYSHIQATVEPRCYAMTVSGSAGTFDTYVNKHDGIDTVLAGAMPVTSFLTSSSGDLRVTVGARQGTSPGVFWDGWIGEIVIFDRSLSTADRTNIRDYLMAKWAI